MIRVAFQGVSVDYGQGAVVDNVTFDVAAGAWLAAIGPNGAGKSSLLNTLVGAVQYAGTVSIDGASIADMHQKDRARRVAFVPQRPVFPPGMTVYDYVLLGRTPFMGPLAAESAADQDEVWSALDAVHLDRFASRAVDTLSGGESQRASLARVVAQQANVLVLDEATASLDLSAQHEVLEMIDGLRRDHGITVVSAMHDLTAAAQFCDRVALLSHGELRAIGSPSDVLTEPILHDVFEQSIRVLSVDGNPVIVSLRSKESAS